MTTLKPLRSPDVEQCQRLDDGPHSWPNTALTRYLDQGAALGLFETDTLVGFLIADSVLDETTLLHLAVGSNHQGRGLARRAMQLWLKGLARQGQRQCLLEVRAGNSAALGLYHRLGFETVGRRTGYYSDEGGVEDALVMVKALVQDS